MQQSDKDVYTTEFCSAQTWQQIASASSAVVVLHRGSIASANGWAKQF